MRLYNIRNGEIEMTINHGIAEPAIPQKNTALNTWSSRLMLFTGGVLVVGNIPVYSSVHQTANEPEAASTHFTKQLNLPAAPIASYSGYSQELDDSSLLVEEGQWISYTVRKKDSFASAFERLQLSKLHKELIANSNIKNTLNKLDAGSTLLFLKGKKEITQIIYLNNDTKPFVISRSGDSYTGKWSPDRVKLHITNRTFSIANSLHHDAKKAKIPTKIANKISSIFKKDINFRKDIKRGDKVTIIYEGIEFDGEPISSRNILAASYEKKNKLYQRIRYTLDNGTTLFLSASGDDSQIRKTAFSRRPIRGRLSSHYNLRRKHPIFRTIRPHKGTDYAAPRGTPIHATADGVVSFKGSKGGYGRTVDLRHMKGITTRYGHMSAYKKGLRSGSRVKRGDVIGYVGSSGNSTGNHVHYEFHVRGKAVNPETVKLPSVGLLSKKDQRGFKMTVRKMVEKLKSTSHVANFGADFTKPSDG